MQTRTIELIIGKLSGVGVGYQDTCERMMRIIDGKRGDEMVPCNWPNHLLVGISPLNRDLGDIFSRVCS